ncbi:MAG: nuclear transport factor 2 family protein [Cyanobacteria bacterium J06631_9]
MDENKTKAAVDAYFKATQSMSVDQWVSRFADGAEVEDPIGDPVLKTRAAIEAQGEKFMSSFKEVGLYPDFVHVIGNRASAKWTGRGITNEGQRVEFDGINFWEFAENEQVKKLVGYWSPSNMREVK